MTPHPQAEILRAIADGHEYFEVQMHGEWEVCVDAIACLAYGLELRIVKPQPKTITGTLTIPEPMRVRPKKGDWYWFASPYCVDADRWDNHGYDELRFNLGIYDTEAKAWQARDAWLEFVHGGAK